MNDKLPKLVFASDYFEREERSGHMVGEVLKRVWAAELEMLAHVDEICQKYGLVYYAYWGTLLGAVRHNGFIPWDDDMDIAMCREDYNKFLEVAPIELPEEYEILNNYVEEWDNVFTKIANSHRLNFGDERMAQFHNCPFAVGIDVFPLDYIPRDKEAAQQQKELLEYISNITSVVVGRKEEAASGVAKEILVEYDRIIAEHLVRLEHICGIRFDNKRTVFQQLNILFDQVSGLYAKEESDEVTSNFNYIRNGYRIPIAFLEDVNRVSFENFMIPIPVGYDEILRKTYREYMVPRKYASTHGEFYFRDQVEVLAEILEQNCRVKISEAEEVKFLQMVEEKVGKGDRRRKIVLMCDDTVEMIAHDAIAVKKLRYALQIFEENEEVLLWWRPGRLDAPQMDVLYNLMPQMLTDYRELVKEYETRDWGVFDKGIDVDKVLEKCDAYYGDDNEIARAFRRAGKPVMIQDYRVCEEA